jgi:diguanylate cyclase (GGDEF)-like protein
MHTAGELADELEALEDRFGVDVDVTQARAAEIERAAEAIGDVPLQLRARLLEANMRRRNGQIAAAAQICSEVNAWAGEHAHRPLLARSHHLLSAIYDNLGDTAAGLEHAVYAVEFLDDTTPARARAVIFVKLADDLAMGGSIEAARERYRRAEQVAVASGDVEMHMVLLNNLAYADYLAGEAQRAWTTIERLRVVSAAAGQPLKPDALDTFARIQIALARYPEAEQTAQDALRAHAVSGIEDIDSLAEFLLTLAVSQRHLGATDAAQASLDRCAVLCDERDLAGVQVRVTQEQAELYAARGDLGRAFETYKMFHRTERELISQQREAQARTRQAMLETTEARQEAERFREQARRDPLTGLHNRRYVDEHLPDLLASAAVASTPVTVAMVDLDHFKRINDVCSHDVGDSVLVAVAGLLAAAVPAGSADGTGFAARLGGEEFLLVLTNLSLADAVRLFDDLRRAIAAHPWRPMTGDLPVTVSIGVAAAQPGSTRASLLTRADENLYAAKYGGRDRVCVDH